MSTHYQESLGNYGTAIVMVTGFGGKSEGISRLADSVEDIFMPKKLVIIPSTPVSRALWHPDTIIDFVREQMEKIDGKKILFGHSYGALMAIAAACRMQLKDIVAVFGIDGPLNPYVTVEPATLSYWLFWRQYLNRPRIAKECEQIGEMAQKQRKLIITTGSTRDIIVPPNAKALPNSRYITPMLNADCTGITLNVKPGLNHVHLPFGGHGICPKRARLITAIAAQALD